MFQKSHYANLPAQGGSMKKQIVNPDLIEEREKCNFDKDEVAHIITVDSAIGHYEPYIELTKKHPELKSTEKFYCMTTEEQQRHWWEKLNMFAKLDFKGYFYN